jgi:hypothetical protein
VSENRVLRRIFGPMREEVAGGWRKLHNEELNNFHSMKYKGYIKNAYNILVGKHEVKTPF